MDEVTLQVDSSVDAPGRSRSYLYPMRAELEPRFDDVVLVVSELVSNSVRHAASDGIAVKVSSKAGWIRIEVSDGGTGFSVDDPRGDGMGLSIIEKLADRWGMHDGQNRFTVWAELSAQPDA